MKRFLPFLFLFFVACTGVDVVEMLNEQPEHYVTYVVFEDGVQSSTVFTVYQSSEFRRVDTTISGSPERETRQFYRKDRPGTMTWCIPGPTKWTCDEQAFAIDKLSFALLPVRLDTVVFTPTDSRQLLDRESQCYSASAVVQNETVGLELCFLDGVHVYTRFSPKTSPPYEIIATSLDLYVMDEDFVLPETE
ncbi:hypothetical protein GF342_03275 [Candidatus Woesearchaeota archaeon]|nr:hypothetical protein [Candidatus Woesearchaeota archaeon]